ncbi:MAG: quaternary ammonium compound efflux SMR transporter SugE [Nitrospiraceae bacterium]
MAWMYLVIAGLFEIAWAIGLKYTEGFTRLWPSAGTVTAMIVSFLCLAESLKSIPVGTGYAVWTGIGAAGTAVMGMILFEESRDPVRILCILTIVAAIAGLKLSSPA